jgi:hypothetical protein
MQERRRWHLSIYAPLESLFGQVMFKRTVFELFGMDP